MAESLSKYELEQIYMPDLTHRHGWLAFILNLDISTEAASRDHLDVCDLCESIELMKLILNDCKFLAMPRAKAHLYFRKPLLRPIMIAIA